MVAVARTTRGAPVKTVLLLCPTMWDESELPHATADGEYDVVRYGTDVSEDPAHFDALAFIDEVVSRFQAPGISGVMASDDYSGSIVAQRWRVLRLRARRTPRR